MQLHDYQKIVTELAVELQRYLISRGAQWETAEDVVQDVFVKILEMELVLPPDKLRPYMYRVAWSTYLDQYRRSQRYRDLVQKYLRPEMTTAQPQPPIGDDLGPALAKLSTKERHLLVLRYDQQLPIAEVAQRLGIKASSVKMRLHRVHHKLEKILRSEQNE
ncbi:RNA polymerase sigma factor [Levilactobacillus cerevisiae]|uniref:RNA polymerase sigma factor n=1 Tax=Levilactobacillus cerevisiae TaxID=1704076 RepID=UPI0013DE5D9C|nr:RNA polymerase sigma factor [Levilactobacillus cerevisiae]